MPVSPPSCSWLPSSPPPAPSSRQTVSPSALLPSSKVCACAHRNGVVLPKLRPAVFGTSGLGKGHGFLTVTENFTVPVPPGGSGSLSHHCTSVTFVAMAGSVMDQVSPWFVE